MGVHVTLTALPWLMLAHSAVLLFGTHSTITLNGALAWEAKAPEAALIRKAAAATWTLRSGRHGRREVFRSASTFSPIQRDAGT